MYQKNENIVMRNIHNTFFLVDLTDNYQDEKCSLYEMNEIGAVVWENIENSLQTITDILLSKTEGKVEYSIVLDDVCSFVKMLEARGFVNEVRECEGSK